MKKLEGSLILEMPVKTTGGQFVKTYFRNGSGWQNHVHLYTGNGNDSKRKRLNSDGRTIFFPGPEHTNWISS